MAIDALGEIETPIGTLRCTIPAFENINARFGSYSAAAGRIIQLDAAAFFVIAAEGLGKKEADVKADVFKAGLQALVKPFAQYVAMLSNGGKLPSDSEDAPSGEA